MFQSAKQRLTEDLAYLAPRRRGRASGLLGGGGGGTLRGCAALGGAKGSALPARGAMGRGVATGGPGLMSHACNIPRSERTYTNWREKRDELRQGLRAMRGGIFSFLRSGGREGVGGCHV